MNQPPVFRIRASFSKLSMLKYTGSLDMQRIWERSFRRARLPLAYSQGFHPQPRINQALPLPLGMTSHNDLAEFWLEQEMDLSIVLKTLRMAVPPGLEIIMLQTVDVHAPSLPTLVTSAQYTALLFGTHLQQQLNHSITVLLAQSEIFREKRGKLYDLRPFIEYLELESQDVHSSQLFMQLSAREGATGRPEEVLAALGFDPLLARIERTRLILTSSGE
jgi:radical SAM-linked protein